MNNASTRQDRPDGSKHTTSPIHWLAIGGGIVAAIFLFATLKDLSTFWHTWVGIAAIIIVALLWRGPEGVTFVRWTARTMGVLWGIVMGGIVVGEMSANSIPGPLTWSGIFTVVTFGGIFIGIVLAFFWEGIGGMLTTLSTLAILISGLIEMQGDLGPLLNPVISIFAFIGLAFLSCWWRSRRPALIHQRFQ